MLNLSYPDQVYSSDNPPSNETLKGDLSAIETAHNSLETEVSALQALVMEAVYPVGSYYFNGAVDTNPATLLGFGTWVAVSDKMIVGKGSTFATLLATGGATTANLAHVHTTPNHSHTYSGTTGTTGINFYANEGDENHPTPDTNHSHTYSGTTSSNNGGNTGSGGSSTQSIMNPYEVACIWRRTA